MSIANTKCSNRRSKMNIPQKYKNAKQRLNAVFIDRGQLSSVGRAGDL
jgi:hypothetical protein